MVGQAFRASLKWLYLLVIGVVTLGATLPTGSLVLAAPASFHRLSSPVHFASHLRQPGGVVHAATAFTGTCEAAPLGAAESFNAFTFGSFSSSASDTEGSMAVGTNATLVDYGVGFLLPNSRGVRDDLVVGGNLSFLRGSAGNGNIVYGGTASLSLVTIPNGSIRQDRLVDFSSAQSYLRGKSTTWSQLTPNGTDTYANGSRTYTLVGTDSVLNIFSLSGASLAQTQHFDITVPSGSTALINVDGSSATFSALGFNLNGADRTRILYNFYQASSLNMTLIGVEGTVFAPFAAINSTNDVVQGQVIGTSYTGNGQINYHLFDGCISSPAAPTATPSPSATPIPTATPVVPTATATGVPIAIAPATATPAIACGSGTTTQITVDPLGASFQYPLNFRITNTGTTCVTVQWLLDCWSAGEASGICTDSWGDQPLLPGESFVKGLGDICSQWQLDLRWTSYIAWPATRNNLLAPAWTVHDQGFVAEEATSCSAAAVSTATATTAAAAGATAVPTSTPAPTSTPTPPPAPPVSGAGVVLYIHSRNDPDAGIYRTTSQRLSWPLGDVLYFSPEWTPGSPSLGGGLGPIYRVNIRTIGWSVVSISGRSTTGNDDLGVNGRIRGRTVSNPTMSSLDGCAYPYNGSGTWSPMQMQSPNGYAAQTYWSAARLKRPTGLDSWVYTYLLNNVELNSLAQIRIQIAYESQVIDRMTGAVVDTQTHVYEPPQPFMIQLVVPRNSDSVEDSRSNPRH